MLKADVVVLGRDSLQVIELDPGQTGGRRPHPITLADGVAAPSEATSPLDVPVQQLAGASAVTADHETTGHHSRGVEAAIEAAADDYNAEEDDETVGVNVDAAEGENAEADVEASDAEDAEGAVEDAAAATDDAEGDIEAPESNTRG